jgi:RsmE family RNA methyltransferase
VNLVLVEPGELASDGTFILADRRAHHLRSVLGARVGSHVRAGVISGGIGRAQVIGDDGTEYVLRLELDAPPPPQLPVELVLAVPRPKVVTRVIETCAAFGIRRIDLTNAWRVDKSYLRSPRLSPEALGHAARLGAEQGATTRLPALAVHDRLMTLLDGRFATPGPRHGALEAGLSSGDECTRLIAHPGAPPIPALTGDIVLAIGPEGGWIERELETFVARGFQPFSIARGILRTEAAVAAALGQLALQL